MSITITVNGRRHAARQQRRKLADLADEVVGKHDRTLSAPQVPSGV